MHQKVQFSYKERPIEIAYTMRPGRDKAILFLHGLGASREDFQKAFEDERLNGYTLISFDFPGHGNSPYVAQLDMNDLAEITKCFAEALKLNSFILIGHSMGGVVGLLYTQKYSSDIKAFINIE